MRRGGQCFIHIAGVIDVQVKICLLGATGAGLRRLVGTAGGNHGSVVERGRAPEQAGNTIMEILGGGAMHSINVRVGGC